MHSLDTDLKAALFPLFTTVGGLIEMTDIKH